MKVKMKPTIEIKNPNQKVEIFDGIGIFTIGETKHEHKVKVFQSWFPNDSLVIESKLMKNFPSWEIEIEIISFYKGKVLVTSKTGFQEIDIEGELSNPINFHFSNYRVKSLDFILFNFVHINGSILKESIDKSSYSLSEIVFESSNLKLILQNYISKTERDDFRKTHCHGFLFSTVGELNFSQPLNKNKIEFYIQRLYLFLSFLNGRRCSPRFIKGFDNNDQLVMQDFSSRIVDTYKHVQSWLPFNMSEKLSPLWSNFLEITNDDDDFEKISLIIHWYLEALNQSGFVDGSIILLQNSYETLFNWVFNEKNEIISEDGIEKLRASDKIRLLLNHFNIDTNLPESYCLKYSSEIQKDKSLVNFAYHFTEIRNLYVHYKKKKAKIKSRYPPLYNYRLLNTGIFKLEVLILKMLKYNGKITSRVIEDFWVGSNQIDI